MSNINLQNVQKAVKALRGAVQGRIIVPEDSDFHDARKLFYGWNDRRPSVIMKAKDERDVARTVVVARESNLEFAIRSGGHSLAGHSMSEGGIVLDLSEMRKLEIDVPNRTAWAQTGMTVGQFTKETGAQGLAVGFGDTASVGIGGITLGGGVGLLVRKHGLTIDNLLAAEVVTADGQFVHTDAESHPELFWAIRGGGGNFGVATRFKFQLCEVDSVVGGIMMVPANAEIIESFIVESERAPEELSVITNVMKAPPMPFIPKEYHGKLVVMAMMVHAGKIESGERGVAPFRKLAKPIMDMVGQKKYPQMFEGPEGPHPVAGSLRSMFIDKVDKRTAETIVEHINASTASMAVTQLRVLGGAMARVPSDATAYAHRKQRIMVNIAALYERKEDASVHDSWVARFTDALNQGDAGVYVNFLGEEGTERIRAAYPGNTWERLAVIKRKYDPTNLFRHNQNIPPANER